MQWDIVYDISYVIYATLKISATPHMKRITDLKIIVRLMTSLQYTLLVAKFQTCSEKLNIDENSTAI